LFGRSDGTLQVDEVHVTKKEILHLVGHRECLEEGKNEGKRKRGRGGEEKRREGRRKRKKRKRMKRKKRKRRRERRMRRDKTSSGRGLRAEIDLKKPRELLNRQKKWKNFRTIFQNYRNTYNKVKKKFKKKGEKFWEHRSFQ
jgi:hypothetical protein